MNKIISEIEKLLTNERDIAKVPQMEAYMRNQFPYIGVNTTIRRKITSPYFASLLLEGEVNWDFIDACFNHPKREFQNIAVDYLKITADKKIVKPKDLTKIYNLIKTRSWWDTVDEISHVIGYLSKEYQETKNEILKWSVDLNMWVRRASIIHQLLLKKDFDITLQEKIIENNLGSNEFFINKAIGWILRDYSYYNPNYVLNYIENNKSKLSSLSIKEGLKRIKAVEEKKKKQE